MRSMVDHTATSSGEMGETGRASFTNVPSLKPPSLAITSLARAAHGHPDGRNSYTDVSLVPEYGRHQDSYT
jgi:hypothetical protein